MSYYSKAMSIAFLMASSAFGAAIDCASECTEEKCKVSSQFALCKRLCKDTPFFESCKRTTFTGVTATDYTASSAEKREAYINRALSENPRLAKFFEGQEAPAGLEQEISEKEVNALRKLLESFIGYGIMKPLGKLRGPIEAAHAAPDKKSQLADLTRINENLKVARENGTKLIDIVLKPGMTVKNVRKEVTAKVIEAMRAGMMAYAEAAHIISEMPMQSHEAEAIRQELSAVLQGMTFIDSYEGFGAIISKHADNRASANTIIQSLFALYKRAKPRAADKKLYATYLVIMNAVLKQIRFSSPTKDEIANSKAIETLQEKYKIPLEYNSVTRNYTSKDPMISNAIEMFAEEYLSKMTALSLDASEDAPLISIPSTPRQNTSSDLSFDLSEFESGLPSGGAESSVPPPRPLRRGLVPPSLPPR